MKNCKAPQQKQETEENFFWTVAAQTCKKVSNNKLAILKRHGETFWALAFHCCSHKAVPELNV